jgi:hypothetical protein
MIGTLLVNDSFGGTAVSAAAGSSGHGSLRRVARRIIPAPVRRRLRIARRIPYKATIIRRYGLLGRKPAAAIRYLLFDRELDNLTYEISNEDELARFIANGIGGSVEDASRYIQELQDDLELRAAIQAALRGRDNRNGTMPYGRRLGWYAIVRARKPRVVVETGVHDGLGSAVLLRGLERNATEGCEGSLVSFDVNENSGWLIPSFVRSRHQLVTGPAPDMFVAALDGRRVDLFIHDSDHRYEHETAEFEAILGLADPSAALVSDNAHAGTAFRDFCGRHSLRFHFFREVPRDHWYPGAGIGLTTLGDLAAPNPRDAPTPSPADAGH